MEDVTDVAFSVFLFKDNTISFHALRGMPCQTLCVAAGDAERPRCIPTQSVGTR